jgi:hypothetical protein
MNNNKVYFDEVHKDEAFGAILRKIEENHNSRVKRIPRTASEGNIFLCTVILENYELLEMTITAGNLGHMAALECEIEVY